MCSDFFCFFGFTKRPFSDCFLFFSRVLEGKSKLWLLLGANLHYAAEFSWLLSETSSLIAMKNDKLKPTTANPFLMVFPMVPTWFWSGV